ncbi:MULTISPECIES: hypothetical protein [Burkholderiaceae]|nr:MULTISPECIES: hypothetical protein [Burkholderiaceae]
MELFENMRNKTRKTDRYNRMLHPDEYAMAKKDASIVAKALGISVQEAEGRIVAEILSNSDQQTASQSGGRHYYEVRSIIGCQNLNCDGYKTDPNYANHDYNSQYITGNQSAYNAGQKQIGTGQTYNELVTNNVKNNPVSTAIAGAGMIALGGVVAGGLPSALGALTGGGIGAAVSSGAQYVFNEGQVNPVDSVMAAITGALTFGTGLLPGLPINKGGALTGSTMKGDNPSMNMAGAAIGTVTGYAIGGKVESALGNRINPWYRPEWIDVGNGVSKYVPPSALPSIGGTTAGAMASEATNAGVNNIPNLPVKR